MQRDEDVKNKLFDIIKDLEEINKKVHNKALDKAIEHLKIALHGDKIGGEGFYHSYIREKLLEMFKGSQYIESSGTKISKLGFRPDVVILNDKEVIIAEIETNKIRAINKMKKIANLMDNIKKHPIATNRNIRIIFCFTFKDNKVINMAKRYGFEVLILKDGNLERYF